jgi:putative FmdB family regulatory protein
MVRMPIYEYSCEAGHVTERLVSLNADIETIKCGECENPAERIISLPTIFSEDFRTAQSYERRKQQPIPIK